MYKVIRKFKDKDGLIYQTGDVYPAPDAKKPTNTRLKTLSTTNNDYGQIYIENTSLSKG